MKKADFIQSANQANVKVDFSAGTSKFTTVTGTSMIKLSTNAGDACVHPDNWKKFVEDVDDEGTLPPTYEISNSGVLFERVPRDRNAKLWEL